MKQSDINRLLEPYTGDPTAPGPGPEHALGITLSAWPQLVNEINSDLSTASPWGIGWWAPSPGTSRRILVSDQLVTCAQSVSSNLVEAKLHWLEFLDYAERESDRMADVITIEKGEFQVKAPRRNNPWEDLSQPLIRLHMTGVVRALASALDCMAGTMIGIAALPLNILKADLFRTRTYLKKHLDRLSPTDGLDVQADLGVQVERFVQAVGPEGWLDWTLAFRNMLVHRGRRLDIGQFVPREPVLYGSTGRPILRARVVTMLPLDPQRSDVEVFLDEGVTPVLTEDAEQTISGLIESTQQLIDRVGALLLDLWRWRKANPTKLLQPAAEWLDGPSTDRLGFMGYAAGTASYDPTQFMTHPAVVQRMRAAALHDRDRDKWSTFD